MSDETAQRETRAVTTTRLLRALREGDLGDDVGLMRWSSNYTCLTAVRHEDLEFMAVYKPRSGERPLWDFPDGTLCLREVAAWETARALGWEIVPPTVLREGAHGPGSLQFYVAHDPEMTYFNLPSRVKPQLRRLSLLDHIINNADRKGGHCLLDGAGRLWGIDHGIAFNAEHRLRTVIWDFAGAGIPPALLNDIRSLDVLLHEDEGPLLRRLSPLLSEREIDALRRRVTSLLREGCWPQPGHGPNVPWPPV